MSKRRIKGQFGGSGDYRRKYQLRKIQLIQHREKKQDIIKESEGETTSGTIGFIPGIQLQRIVRIARKQKSQNCQSTQINVWFRKFRSFPIRINKRAPQSSKLTCKMNPAPPGQQQLIRKC